MRITLSKAENKILSAVKKAEEFVAPTYGPAGSKNLIRRSEFDREGVDDGRRSLESFELKDEFEQAVIEQILEVVRKTKDGTTTAFLTMCGIVFEALKDLDNPLRNDDYHGMILSLREGLKDVLKKVKGKPIKTKEELYKVAYNSYKNEEIAELIADTIFKIGKDGVVEIGESRTPSTIVEVVNGLEINRGYASQDLINSEKREVVAKEAPILLVNRKLNTLKEVMGLLTTIKAGPMGNQPVFDNANPVIIADGFGDDILNRFAIMKSMGIISPSLVEIPSSHNKLDILKDIAIVVGAKVIDDKILTLDKATKDVLGFADMVVSSTDKTKIIGGAGKKADIKDYVDTLKALDVKTDHEKDALNKRIAQLNGGVSIIKLGAYTDTALKGMKTKVENAVNSTQSAYRSGVVAGAGKTLMSLETSSPLLNEALKYPRKVLERNGEQYLDENTTDSAEVVLTAITTGVEIAEELLSLAKGGISTEQRKYDVHGNAL